MASLHKTVPKNEIADWFPEHVWHNHNRHTPHGVYSPVQDGLKHHHVADRSVGHFRTEDEPPALVRSDVLFATVVVCVSSVPGHILHTLDCTPVRPRLITPDRFILPLHVRWIDARSAKSQSHVSGSDQKYFDNRRNEIHLE
jgi:hypothetical protein